MRHHTRQAIMSAHSNQLRQTPDQDSDQWRDGVMALPQAFMLDSGQVLRGGHLAWQCAGPETAPLIVVLGGISADRHCCARDNSGWWQSQCGAGQTLDSRRFRLLGIDWLGGRGDSSNAGSPQRLLEFSSADQARALLLLLNRIGVSQVHLLVGASYGGAVAQQLAILLGSRLRRLVLLCAAHRSSQFALGFREIQRAILDLDSDSPTALSIARSLALLGYRTAQGLEQRFANADAAADVIGWLAHHGEKFAQNFAASSYRCLGASLDTHRINPASIHVPTTLFGVVEDLLVPRSLLREFVESCGGECNLVEVSSVYGHDAFLKEKSAVAEVLQTALEIPA